MTVFDKDRLEDMVGEIIIERDEDDNDIKNLIDMALQLSQYSEANKYSETSE